MKDRTIQSCPQDECPIVHAVAHLLHQSVANVEGGQDIVGGAYI